MRTLSAYSCEDSVGIREGLKNNNKTLCTKLPVLIAKWQTDLIYNGIGVSKAYGCMPTGIVLVATSIFTK